MCRKLKILKKIIFIILITTFTISFLSFTYSQIKYKSFDDFFYIDKYKNHDARIDLIGAEGESIINVDKKIEFDREVLANSTKAAKSKNKVKNENNFFKKTLFVGNSITEGLSRFGGIEDATFVSMEGLNVNTFFSTDKFKFENKKMTPNEATKTGKFKRVFLMFGVNELGWRSQDAFISRYKDVISSIEENQPNAKIYVQSILYVTKKLNNSSKIYNNKNILQLNKKIKKMAYDNKCKYVDLNKALCNGKKYLPKDASTDGMHLNVKYCKKWKDYLVKYFDLKRG